MDGVLTVTLARFSQLFFFTVYRFGLACLVGIVIVVGVLNNFESAMKFEAQFDRAGELFFMLYLACAVILLPFYLAWVGRNVEPPLRRFDWYMRGLFGVVVVPFWFARQVAIGDKKLRESGDQSTMAHD